MRSADGVVYRFGEVETQDAAHYTAQPDGADGGVLGKSHRSVAQLGRAPRSGRGGRRFKSSHSDQSSRRCSTAHVFRPDPTTDAGCGGSKG
jgi:hypothetical protein